MMAFVFTAWSQAALAGEWSPVPILSVGALIALCGVAATFGAVRTIANSNERNVEKWREETRQEFKEVRSEHRESMSQLRGEIKAVADSVVTLGKEVARMEGHQ